MLQSRRSGAGERGSGRGSAQISADEAEPNEPNNEQGRVASMMGSLSSLGSGMGSWWLARRHFWIGEGEEKRRAQPIEEKRQQPRASVGQQQQQQQEEEEEGEPRGEFSPPPPHEAELCPPRRTPRALTLKQRRDERAKIQAAGGKILGRELLARVGSSDTSSLTNEPIQTSDVLTLTDPDVTVTEGSLRGEDRTDEEAEGIEFLGQGAMRVLDEVEGIKFMGQGRVAGSISSTDSEAAGAASESVEEIEERLGEEIEERVGGDSSSVVEDAADEEYVADDEESARMLK